MRAGARLLLRQIGKWERERLGALSKDSTRQGRGGAQTGTAGLPTIWESAEMGPGRGEGVREGKQGQGPRKLPASCPGEGESRKVSIFRVSQFLANILMIR